MKWSEMQSQTRTAQTLLSKGSSKEVRYLVWPGTPQRVWHCCSCRSGRRQYLQPSPVHCIHLLWCFYETLLYSATDDTKQTPCLGQVAPSEQSFPPEESQQKMHSLCFELFSIFKWQLKKARKPSGQSWKDNCILWHNSWHMAAGSKAQPRAHLLRHRNGKLADSLNSWFTLSANTRHLH